MVPGETIVDTNTNTIHSCPRRLARCQSDLERGDAHAARCGTSEGKLIYFVQARPRTSQEASQEEAGGAGAQRTRTLREAPLLLQDLDLLGGHAEHGESARERKPYVCRHLLHFGGGSSLQGTLLLVRVVQVLGRGRGEGERGRLVRGVGGASRRRCVFAMCACSQFQVWGGCWEGTAR